MVTTQKYHFFTSSIAYWRVNKSLRECIDNQVRADNSLNAKVTGFNVYKVLVPIDTQYKINNYMPVGVEIELIHYEEYQSS